MAEKIKIETNSISLIEELFNVKSQITENSFSFRIAGTKQVSLVNLDIIKDEKGEYLISVYTNNCHLQLQSCSGFVISKMLEEIIFIAEEEHKISGLLISKQADCSLYSNVDKSLLNSNFESLDSEKLIAVISLSVTDSSN